MAKREGWDQREEWEFKDEGFSAFHRNRGPGLAAAKVRAEQLAADYGSCILVVQHSDRLARGDGHEAQHLAQVWWWAHERRIVLRSVQDDALGNALLATVMGMRNNEDSARKSQATKAGLRRRAERGHRHGGRSPYGFRWVRDRNNPSDQGQLVTEPSEKEVVVRAFTSYLGGAGDGAIADQLTQDGIQAPRARRWDKSQISNMLQNPLYVGLIRFNGETFEGQHEAFVSREMWDEAQRLRNSRRAASGGGRGRYPSGRHLLVKGLLRCGICGGAMSPRTLPSGYELYRCLTRHTSGGYKRCQQPDMPRRTIDEALFTYFECDVLDLDATRIQLTNATEQWIAEGQALVHAAEREVAQLEADRAAHWDNFKHQRITPEEWTELRTELEADTEALEAKLSLLHKREREAAMAVVAFDAESDTLRRLSELREAVAGRVESREGVEAVRATLTTCFESFTLRRLWEDDAPEFVHLELSVGLEYALLPKLRESAIAGYVTTSGDAEVTIPLVRRESLYFGETIGTPGR